MARRANGTPSSISNPNVAESGPTEPRAQLPHRYPNSKDWKNAQSQRSERGELASPSTLILRANDSSKTNGHAERRSETIYEAPQRASLSTSTAPANHKRSYDRCSSEGSKCSQESHSDNGVDGYVWVTRKRSKDEEPV